MNLFFFWVPFLHLFSIVLSKPLSKPASPFTLTVLHTNDIHGRYLETNQNSLSCSESEGRSGKCFGGYARIFTKVKEIRRTHPNVILLSGGDFDRGTLWHTVYKWKAFTHFTNQFNYTAMALGNHDFDEDVEGIVPLLETIAAPVLVANMDDSEEPSMGGKTTKSVVVSVCGRKIGIIGYISIDTPELSHTGRLRFEHEVGAIGKEAKRLHESGVDILIALGHSGYKEDLRIARVPYIDLVVGAHSHTFLYTGDAPDIEEPLAAYPTVVTQDCGKEVPVVQAYAFTKYLGYINVTFNEDGEALSWNGSPILLNSAVPQDPGMLAELEKWDDQIDQYSAVNVGETRVFLDMTPCRAGECSLGSFITDAMVHTYNSHAKMQRSALPSRPDISIALINSGSIRASLGRAEEDGKLSNITMADVMTLLPYANTVYFIELEGRVLREALEHSVTTAGVESSDFGGNGKFLQVSGLRLIFNMSEPDGSRVSSVHVASPNNGSYAPLRDNEVYRLLANEFIANGGDGYEMLRDQVIRHRNSGIKDIPMLLEYIREKSPISQKTDGRIVVEPPNTGQRKRFVTTIGTGYR